MPEKYSGVKFIVKKGALKKGVVSDPRINEMVLWAKALSERGFASGNSGNLSVRKEEGFIIKGTGGEFARLNAKDFVFVKEFDYPSFELVSAIGKSLPSSETPLHHAIYSARPDVHAIVHCHAFPKGVQETEKEFDYGSAEQTKAVCDILKNRDIAIAKNHGVFSVGRTVKEAAIRILKLTL